MKLWKPRRQQGNGEKWGQCSRCGVYADTTSSSYMGRWYPESQLTRYKGRLYCQMHMMAKKHDMEDDEHIFIDEGDRGEGIKG